VCRPAFRDLEGRGGCLPSLIIMVAGLFVFAIHPSRIPGMPPGRESKPNVNLNAPGKFY